MSRGLQQDCFFLIRFVGMFACCNLTISQRPFYRAWKNAWNKPKPGCSRLQGNDSSVSTFQSSDTQSWGSSKAKSVPASLVVPVPCASHLAVLSEAWELGILCELGQVPEERLGPANTPISKKRSKVPHIFDSMSHCSVQVLVSSCWYPCSLTYDMGKPLFYTDTLVQLVKVQNLNAPMQHSDNHQKSPLCCRRPSFLGKCPQLFTEHLFLVYTNLTKWEDVQKCRWFIIPTYMLHRYCFGAPLLSDWAQLI